MRSGTENVFGISCFRYAAEEKFATLTQDGSRLADVKELIWQQLDHKLFSRISPSDGSPYILTVSARGKRGEALQRMLWDKGVAVGTGSACNSKKPHSRVLEACGYEDDVLSGILRVSFSPRTTEEDVRIAAEAMNEAARQFGGL